MEILHLFSTYPSSGSPDEEQPRNYADGAPRFILITASRLPVKRLFQGLGAECAVLLVGLFLAWALAPIAAQKSPDGPDTRHDKKPPITIYYPPVKKRAPETAPRLAKSDAKRRRFSLPPKPVQAVAAPAIETPPIVTVKAEPAPQASEKGLPLPSTPAPAILQVNVGSPRGSSLSLPNLDASPARAAVLSQHGTHADGDPLASTLSGTHSFGRGFSVAGTSGGPPDLSPKPLYAAARAEPQVKSAFTKPQILFMPKPAYPPAVLAERIEGDVMIEVTFDKSGRVIFRRFVQQLQNTELNSIARETAERIKFAPAKRDDVPVDQDSVITVFFRLSQLNMTASF